MADGSDATRILEEINRGDASAVNRLLPLVYDELRAIAAAAMRRERVDHTLEPTALVHEAYVRLVDHGKSDWRGRAHFFAVAAKTIRNVLIDHARRADADKRGGAWRRTMLSGELAGGDGPRPVDLLDLDAALARLGELHPRQANVVELRFFGGLSIEETAHVLDAARSTVADDWMLARAWLSRELDR